MKPAPQRLILQVFTTPKWNLTDDQIAQLRALAQNGIAAEGGQLVDFIVDRGPPKRDPAEHASLMRIARGEADGLVIMQFPLYRGRTRKRTPDVLASQLAGPFLMLTSGDLVARGLMPAGVVPLRSMVDVIRRALLLRLQGFTYGEIGAALDEEGFSPLYANRWSASGVSKLLKRHEAGVSITLPATSA